MPIPVLDKLEFETVEGLWRIEYIGGPKQANEDRATYYLRCKWVDPNNRENKATPERRLRLTVYPSQTIYSDFEDKLKAALNHFLENMEDCEVRFDRDSAYLLKPRATQISN